MTIMKALILASVLIVSCLAVNCPIDPLKQTRIQSGSIGLQSQQNNGGTNKQNLVYNHKFGQSFSAIPSVAIGLNQIQAAQSPSLDIRVTNAKTSPTGIYFKAESGEDSLWKNCKINFMATNRNDMQLGSSSISAPVINPLDNTFNMIYNLKNSLPADGLKVKSFIQGMNLYSSNKGKIGVKQQNSYLSGKQVYFTFGSAIKSSIVRSLTISIIVFNTYTPSILYADGSIDQNFVVSTTNVTIPRHGINELRTYIVGINSFETTAAQPISITSAIDETFSLVIGPIDRTQIDFVSVSYLILSVVDCGSCQGNPLLFDGLCQPICPAGFKSHQGRCVPSQCQPGQTFDSNYNCVPICGKNEVYSSGTCICIDGLYRIDGKCGVCPVGSYYDFKQSVCRSLCSYNSYFKNGRCYCNPGYYLIKGSCQKCTYGTKYDIYSQSCVSQCGDNEIYSPSGCVCANNYVRVNGLCQRCPYQTVYDATLQQCVCGQGLELVYGQCIPVCKQNEVRVDGTCLCAPGLWRINGRCGRCPPFSSYNTVLQQCLCDPNYTQRGGACVPNCTYDQYYSNGQCISYCKQTGEYYYNGICQCYDDYERINGVCVPKCLQFEIRVNGICTCKSGYFKTLWSPVCQPVNCPPGTSFDYVRGDCISVCKPNQIYINGQCVCQYGYNNANSYGDCMINCSDSEISVNGVCECRPQYVRVGPGCCVPSNPSNFDCKDIYVFGQCSTPSKCPADQFWTGLTCSCYNGYYRVNNKCVPVNNAINCPPNSNFNGVNCQCGSGYFPNSPNACDSCPPGTYWNGVRCVRGGNGNNCEEGCDWDPIKGNCYRRNTCKANEYWDGASCRCNQGFFLIQGKCDRCPANTVFDGYRCSPGLPNKQCKDPYSFFNGNICVCIPGYWQLSDGRCITCPLGTTWDGTCCKQNSGQPIPLTTC